MIKKLFFILVTIAAFPLYGIHESSWERDAPFLDVPIKEYYERDACANDCGYRKIENIDFKKLWDVKGLEESKPTGQYRLQIGDRLFISLYGFGEQGTAREVVVEPTGNISYLFIDPIPALGRTIDEMRRDLEEKIRVLFPNVLVAMTATELLGSKYTILGEVVSPGTKPIIGDMTLLKAIADSNGFPITDYRGQLIDYADLDRAFLARNGEYVPVKFQRLIKHGDLSEDVKIQSGDYIYIPSIQTKSVYILGEVGSNAIYNYLHRATLAEVLAWAGDITPAASCFVCVIRGSLDCPTHYVINYNKIRQGICRDFCLQPGDIVYVPSSPFYTIKEIIKNALRIFVGSIAVTAGVAVFEEIEPRARDIRESAVIINPGVPVQTIPLAVP